MSPFGMAIVLPVIPEIVERFDSGYSAAQFVVSGYLLGIAVAQPAIGFLCDRFGRRPVMLGGLATFVVASIGLSVAATLPQLIALRVLQAVGAGAGSVVSRAVVQDTCTAETGTRAMSRLTIGLGVAPVVAPMAGGWLAAVGGADAIFLATAALGVVVLSRLAYALPETRDTGAEAPGWSAWFGGYRRLLVSRPFVGYTLVFGFVQGGFFAFLAVGAAVFESSFGIGPAAFGLIWGAMTIAFVVGATVGGRLSVSTLSRYVFPTGAWLTPVAGLALLVLTRFVGAYPGTVLLPILLMMTLSGLVMPAVLAGPVYHHPDIAGTSAGLSSALGLVVGSSFTIASGMLYAGAFEPIAVLIFVATILTALSSLLVSHSGVTAR